MGGEGEGEKNLIWGSMKMGSEVFYDIKVVNFSHSLHILAGSPPRSSL